MPEVRADTQHNLAPTMHFGSVETSRNLIATLVQQVLPHRVPTACMHLEETSPVLVFVGTWEDQSDVMTCARSLGVKDLLKVCLRNDIPPAGLRNSSVDAAAANPSGVLAAELAGKELRRRLQSASIEYWEGDSDAATSIPAAPMIRVHVNQENFESTNAIVSAVRGRINHPMLYLETVVGDAFQMSRAPVHQGYTRMESGTVVSESQDTSQGRCSGHSPELFESATIESAHVPAIHADSVHSGHCFVAAYTVLNEELYAVCAGQRLSGEETLDSVSTTGQTCARAAEEMACIMRSQSSGSCSFEFVRTSDSMPGYATRDEVPRHTQAERRMIAHVDAFNIRDGDPSQYTAMGHLSREVLVTVRRKRLAFPSLPHWLDYSGKVFFLSGAKTSGCNKRWLKVVGYTERIWPDSMGPPTSMMCYLAVHEGGTKPSHGDSGRPVFKTEDSGVDIIHSFIRAECHSTSASGEARAYYLLTPAHFLLEQLQASPPFADAGAECIDAMRLYAPKSV